MVTPYEAFTAGAKAARDLAMRCAEDAARADPERAARLVEEHDRHIARAMDYEMRAHWYAPKAKQEIAA